MSDAILPPGSCKHRPTSNGWSAGLRQSPYSWCGYCKALVEHDAEWTAKFNHTPSPRGGRTPAAAPA